MKKALVAVMCSAMVLGAAGCGTSGNEVKTGEISNVEIVEKGVNLFVKRWHINKHRCNIYFS